MNTKTQSLTRGAMLTAIFAVMLLFNRQTGGMFQEIFLIMMPMPLAAYSIQYGFKKSLVAWVAMCCIGFFFGTFNTIFYSVSQSLIGLIFGSLLYKKIETTHVMFAVMGLAMLSSAVNLILNILLYGLNMDQQAAEYGDLMEQTYSQANMEVPSTLINADFLKQMLCVGYLAMGLIEGFVIFQLTLVVLKRLRFTVEKPVPLFDYYPPKVLGLIAIAAFIGYYVTAFQPLDDTKLQNLTQTLGMCGFMYLAFFGFLGIVLYLRRRTRLKRGMCIVIAILLFFILPMLPPIAGALYTSTNVHRDLMAEGQAGQG